MKKLLRPLAITMVIAILITSLCGCGQTAPKEEIPAESESPFADVKIGFICWSYIGALEKSYKHTMEYLSSELGFEVEFAEASQNEALLSAAENLIENGCNAIMATNAPPTMMELCEKNGVYFIQYSNNVDEVTKAEFEKSKYWLGYITDDDTLSGYHGIKALVDQGCTTIGLLAPPAGLAPNQDSRVAGMIKACEDFNIKYYEYRGLEFIDAVANFCTIYPELNGIFGTSASSGLFDGYMQTIDTCGKSDQVKVGTFDIPENADVFFSEGIYKFAAGGQFADAELCVAVILNQLTGTPLQDGPIYAAAPFIELLSADDYADYLTCIAGDIPPYNADEIRQLIKSINPDASADDIVTYSENYSLASVKDRR